MNSEMAERRAKGLLWIDTEENIKQQICTKGLCRDFNQTCADEPERRSALLGEIFASCGKNVWIEPPLHAAIGKTVTIGEGTYINSNLTLVDDEKITVGADVLQGSGN